MSHRIHTRRRGGLLAFGALLVALLTGIAAPAYAHDELLGTDPEQGSTVDALPGEITMTFSGVLLADAGASEIEVLDASCRSLVSGDPVFDGTRVRQPLSGDATGPITVVWRVVSSDGHPIDGEWDFSVGDDAGQTPCASAPDATTTSDFDPTVLLIVGGVVVVGVIVAIVLLARKRPSDED